MVYQFAVCRQADDPAIHPPRRPFMRMLTILIAALSLIALAACSRSDDDTGQSRRGQAGPYISGSGGVGF